VNPNSPVLQSVIIKDLATITAYRCSVHETVDIQADAKNIYLVCAKAGLVGLHVSFIPHPLEVNTSEAIFGPSIRDMAGQMYFLQHL